MSKCNENSTRKAKKRDILLYFIVILPLLLSILFYSGYKITQALDTKPVYTIRCAHLSTLETTNKSLAEEYYSYCNEIFNYNKEFGNQSLVNDLNID